MHTSSTARKAFEGEWRKGSCCRTHEARLPQYANCPAVTPQIRGKLLTKLADLLDRDIEILASIEALDNGKSVTMAKGDIGAASGCIRYYGGWADKIEGKTVDTGDDTFNYIRKEPVSYGALQTGRE